MGGLLSGQPSAWAARAKLWNSEAAAGAPPRTMAMPPPTGASPWAASQSAEPARLGRVDAEEGAGAAREEEGEQAPGVGGVAGDDRARHLAAAEGAQRRVAREAAAVADDREAAGAGERRDEARAVHAGGGAVEGGDGVGVAGLGPGDALRGGDGGDRALLLDDAMRLDEAELLDRAAGRRRWR